MTSEPARAVPAARMRWILSLTTASTFVYYLFILTNGTMRVFAPIPLGMAFNSMLDHMLHGQFDVDPDAIRAEGFVSNGRVYAYFGPFAAMLRLPLLLVGGLARIDISRLSCAIALTLAVCCRLASLLLIYRAAPPSPLTRNVFFWLVLAAPLSGLPAQFLVPAIYYEVIDWAYACNAAFMFIALRLVIRETRQGAAALLPMAVIAGWSLATRVTTGAGLYLATTLMILVRAWSRRPTRASVWKALVVPGSLGALAILATFAVAVLFVNQERWGNPLEFGDMRKQITSLLVLTYRIAVISDYGNFNLQRIPFNLQYYFFPIWVLKNNGVLIFDAFQRSRMMAVELPPGTPLLTDPVMVYFAAVFALAARHARVWSVMAIGPVISTFAGLGVGALAILALVSATYRYRCEVYSPLEFAALLGFHVLAQSNAFTRRRVVLVAALSITGIIMAHLFLMWCMAKHFGPAELVMTAPTIVHEFYWSIRTVAARFGEIPVVP